MALTVEALAVAMRLTADGATLPTAQRELLTRTLGAGRQYVEQYAPEAPEDVRDEATIRLCAYLYDAPPSPRGDGFSAPFRNSGAAGLLMPWRVHRAGGSGA